MQVKVYEITWGETQTTTGAIGGSVVTYSIAFSDQGVQGQTGPQGPIGEPNTLTIGTVTTGAPGSNAAASVTGSAPNQILSLTIPRGDVGATGATGATGPANTLSIGTVSTGSAGSNAAASITGTAPNQTLSLTIPRGDQGIPGTGIELLTTKGDLLYQNTSAAARLPIGTSGQILKVAASGVPEWGAAPASGVTSVNGHTGTVTLIAADIGAAEDIHSHQPADIYSDAVYVSATTLSGGEPNGLYFRNGSDNGKAIYKSAAGYALFWSDENKWTIGNNAQSAAYFVSATDSVYPWQATGWIVGPDGSGTAPAVAQATLSQIQFDAATNAVSTRTPKTGNAGSTEVVLGSDTRLTNSRQPTLHASTHHTGGTDSLAAHQINGQTIFSISSATYSADQTLSAQRARQQTISNTNASGINVTLPTGTDGTLAGDTYVIIGGNTVAGTITIRGFGNMSPPIYTTLATITATGQQYRFRAAGGTTGGWSLVPVDSHTHGNLSNDGKIGSTSGLPLKTGTNGVVEAGAFGTSAGTFCEGNDSRLSDSRTPSAHGSTHHTGGTDALAAHQINGQTIFGTGSATYSTDQTLGASRAFQFTVGNTNASGINLTLPTGTNGTLLGDTYVLIGGGTLAGPITVRAFTNISPPIYQTLATITATGQQFRFRSAGGNSGGWSLVPVDTHTHTAADVTSGELSPLRIPNFEVKSANHTALTNEKVAADTTAGAFTLTLPATPSNGDTVTVLDYASTFDTNNLTIARNGSNIESLAEDLVCEVEDAAFTLVYVGSTVGWKVVPYYGTAVAVGGATNLWIPASAWIPKTTAGCGVDSRETSSHDQNFDELLFDAGSDEFADALVVMPSNYNNSTITARFYWTAASGSGDVIWAIQGRAFANDDALDTAAGTAQTVTDTLIAADDMHVSGATSAVTIGGTPAANTPIQFSIYRDANAAGDTLAVDARLLGVEIIFN